MLAACAVGQKLISHQLLLS